MSKNKPQTPVAQLPTVEQEQVLESARPVGTAEAPILQSVGMVEGKRGGWVVYEIETQGETVVSKKVLNEDGRFLGRAAAENLAKVTFANAFLFPRVNK